MWRPREKVPPGLFVLEQALDEVTLKRVRRELAGAPGEPVEVRGPEAAVLAVDTAVRRAWEVCLSDRLANRLVDRIDALRPALESCCGVPLEPCDGVAALRYPAGAFYRRHRDVGREPDDLGLHRRVVSIVIFLNSGGDQPSAAFAGGRLRLYGLIDDPDDTGVDIEPEAGTLVAFPSSVPHEVTPVIRGERYSLVTWLLSDLSRRG